MNTLDTAGANEGDDRPWISIAPLLVFVFLLHFWTLMNPFLLDDYVYLETVKGMDWAKVVDVFTTSTMGEEASGVWWTPTGVLPFYRPLGEMLFYVEHAVWGINPFGYHLTNLLLHLLCTFLTWKLALRLFRSPSTAIVAATVFAIHPVHNEAVAWISGRFDLLSAACVLMATLCYMNWRERGPRHTRWMACALACYVVGLGCKETMLILPAVFLGIELVGWPGSDVKMTPRRMLLPGLWFAAIGLTYVAGRFALFGGLGDLPPPYGVDFSDPMRAATRIVWHFSQYMLDFVLFIQVDAFYIASFWLAHPVLLAIVLAIALAIVVAIIRLSWRSVVFRVGLFWVACYSTPALLAMPGERNVYLSSIGVALMAAAALRALASRWAARPQGVQRVRRIAAATLGLWVVMNVVEQSVMWGLATVGESVYRDIEAAMPNPAPGTRVYVVNQCPLNAVGFEQALRLRYDRPDLAGWALSLSPTLEETTVDTIVRAGPQSIRMTRKNGTFFQSVVDQFHLFSAEASVLHEASERAGLSLIDRPKSYDGLTELSFRLPYPLDDERIQLFRWDNGKIHGPLDYPGLSANARLRRCDLSLTETARTDG